MGFYIVTIKKPSQGFRNAHHEKELGPCSMSPTCTDCEGLHHSYVGKAKDINDIFAQALRDGVHITRVEEIYHVKNYEVDGDVSAAVRDADSDRAIPSGSTGSTEFDLAAVPGFDIHRTLEQFFPAILEGSSDGDGGVPGSTGYGLKEARDDIRNAPYPKDLIVRPDGEGIIRN